MLQIHIDCDNKFDEVAIKTRNRILRGLSNLKNEGYTIDIIDYFPNMSKLMEHKRVVLIGHGGTIENHRK